MDTPSSQIHANIATLQGTTSIRGEPPLPFEGTTLGRLPGYGVTQGFPLNNVAMLIGSKAEPDKISTRSLTTMTSSQSAGQFPTSITRLGFTRVILGSTSMPTRTY